MSLEELPDTTAGSSARGRASSSHRLRILLAVILFACVVVGLTVLSGNDPVAVGQSVAFTHPDQCAKCHSEIAREVEASTHGQAFTDPDALALSKNFQDEQCISCHAPAPIYSTGVGERVFARRDRRVTGVDCLSCHLLPDGTVAGTRGLTSAPCKPVLEPTLSKAVFCAGCHNQHWTVDEFMAWKADTGRPETCNECHMSRVDRPLADGGPVRKGVARHYFEGGHFLPKLQEGLKLEASLEDGKLLIHVTNCGAGHKVPTDSRHKSFNLLVTVKDKAGNILKEQTEVAEYRLYYRDQNKPTTQITPGETREHTVDLPTDRNGTALVELVYCLKPPEKLSKKWTVVHTTTVEF